MAGSGSCCGSQARGLCVPPSFGCSFSLGVLLQLVWATAEARQMSACSKRLLLSRRDRHLFVIYIYAVRVYLRF